MEKKIVFFSFSLFFMLLFSGCGKKREVIEETNPLSFSIKDLKPEGCEAGQVVAWGGKDWMCVSLKHEDIAQPDEGKCAPSQVLMWSGKSWVCAKVKLPTAKENFESYMTSTSVPYLKRVLVSKDKINEETSSITFTVEKKNPDYVAKKITKTYQVSELDRDFLGTLILPVFGLYHDHLNKVEIEIDSPSQTYTKKIRTGIEESSYLGEIEKYVSFTSSSQKPAFDFFLLETADHGSVIMDIDGEIRWQFPVSNQIAWTSVFHENKLFYYHTDHLFQIGLDWSLSIKESTHHKYDFVRGHHQMTRGKKGYLFNAHGVRKEDKKFLDGSMLVEVDTLGTILKTWDLGEIIRQEMEDFGDDPNLFVREGFDWCHTNSAIYTTPEDDALLVSSRENFLMKIDYDTGSIRWIFGDTSKYWYQFPSLARLALSTEDLPPIGQHSLSLIKDDPTKILMFNNGEKSRKQPEEAPVGVTLESSRPVIFKIDEENKTGTQLWEYEADRFSATRSSVLRSSDNKHSLVLYTHGARLHIIDEYSKLVLDLQFPDGLEEGIWRAVILDDIFSY